MSEAALSQRNFDEEAEELRMIDFPINESSLERVEWFFGKAYPASYGDITAAQQVAILRLIPELFLRLPTRNFRARDFNSETYARRLGSFLNGISYEDLSRQEGLATENAARTSVRVAAERLGNSFDIDTLLNTLYALDAEVVGRVQSEIDQIGVNIDPSLVISEQQALTTSESIRTSVAEASYAAANGVRIPNHVLDNLAEHCQAILRAEESARKNPTISNTFQEAFALLEAGVAAEQNRLRNFYFTNTRFDESDFTQTLRLNLLQSILPGYDRTRAPFRLFYRGVAWKRLEETIARNTTQFSSGISSFRKRNSGGNVESGYERATRPTLSFGESLPGGKSDEGILTEEIVPAGEAYDVEAITLSSERLQILATAFKRLTDLEKAAIQGVFIEGKSYDSVAAETGTTFKAIDNAIMRAKRKIAQTLASGGYEITAKIA